MKHNLNATIVRKHLQTRIKFLHHRKRFLKYSVQTCKNIVSGKCKYGNGKCWFNHDESKDSTEDKNSDKKIEEDVIEKLVKMMEKFTQQIVEMKVVNNLK